MGVVPKGTPQPPTGPQVTTNRSTAPTAGTGTPLGFDPVTATILLTTCQRPSSGADAVEGPALEPGDAPVEPATAADAGSSLPPVVAKARAPMATTAAALPAAMAMPRLVRSR